MEEIKVTVIGAGVVGLAIAAEAARDEEVYVLEKNQSFGQETSSRNSEVIHAGIYYPPGSLKARLCVEGNARLYELCEQHGIGCQKLGKLIVATEEAEISELEKLLANGRGNGASLELLEGSDVKKMEPAVKALAAIFSPATGIIDSHRLMKYFEDTAKGNNATIVYQCEVKGVKKLADKYQVTIEDSEGTSSFLTTVLINSTGLSADRIAEMAGIDIGQAGYRLHYSKGEYFSLNQRPTKRLVYPVPGPKRDSLGVHITPDLTGRVRLGPNAYYVTEIDYTVNGNSQPEFYDSVKKILPTIEYDDLAPDFAGIRPQLQGPGEDFRDFIIRHEADRGLAGLINLIGIESPGLTAAPAIAKLVKSMVDEIV